MPPFGSLFGVPVYVSSRLGLLDNIAFNGGSHSELIQISYKDFERVVKPKILAMQ
jgi:Ala-tRNA(Pro) deacylase